jgi:hypothetical protein
MNAFAQTTQAISVALLTMIFGASVFELTVLVPNWRRPDGMVPYRELCRRRHPGHYYQVLAPITIVVSAAAFVLALVVGANSVLAAGPLVCVVLAEILTLTLFLPINRKLFFEPVEAQPGDQSRQLVGRWERANLVRLGIVAIGVVTGFAALSQSA